MRDYNKITNNDLITLSSKGDVEAVKKLRGNVASLEQMNQKCYLDEEICNILHRDFPDVFNKIIDYINE